MEAIIMPRPALKGGAFMEALERSIRLGIQKERVIEQARMNRIARQADAIGGRAIAGLGQCAMRIPTTIYLRWLQEGKMKDPEFRKSLWRDNPELRAAGFKPGKKWQPGR